MFGQSDAQPETQPKPQVIAIDERRSSQDGSTSSDTPFPKPNRFYRLFSFLGFSKGYNIPLFIIFAGAMLGFCLARLQYLNIGGNFRKNAAQGEWYWYQRGIYRFGITLHLATILPAGLLMVWQFIPAIRHRVLLFHRINGYIIILLVFLSNIGALMIVRRAFGGYLSTQAGTGILVIMTTTGMSLAYYNIKKLQIEQHRAWMLRTMFYLGTIITMRLIMALGALVISQTGGYYSPMTCGELNFTIDDPTALGQRYPACAAALLNTNTTTTSSSIDSTVMAVPARFSENSEEVGAALRTNFGMALWLAIFLHAVGVEIYLRLTPREAERLRLVSYQRQLEAGAKQPGSAGLVVEKFGDANEWRQSIN